MSRKTRIDSTAEAVAVAKASSAAITAPSNVPLDGVDLPFFASVLAEFARSEWTAHQLELAAMLARTMADLNTEQIAMRSEGSICKTDKGTPVINPRKTASRCTTVISILRVAAYRFTRVRKGASLVTLQSGAMRSKKLRTARGPTICWRVQIDEGRKGCRIH
jgi:hypothetical protein